MSQETIEHTKSTTTVDVPLLVPRLIKSLEDLKTVWRELRHIKQSKEKIAAEPAVVKAKLTLSDAQRRTAELTDREKGLLGTVRTTARRFLRGYFKREGYKTRTLKLVDGTQVALRKTTGSVVVTNDELALEWARENAPEAIVQVETVQPSKLSEENRLELLRNPRIAAGLGFGVTQPTENVNWTY